MLQTLLTNLDDLQQRIEVQIKKLSSEITSIEQYPFAYMSLFTSNIQTKNDKRSYLKTINEQLILVKEAIENSLSKGDNDYKLNTTFNAYRIISVAQNIIQTKFLINPIHSPHSVSYEKDRGRTGLLITESESLIKQLMDIIHKQTMILIAEQIANNIEPNQSLEAENIKHKAFKDISTRGLGFIISQAIEKVMKNNPSLHHNRHIL